jgi:flagellar basal-body rod protein FlgF
MNIQLNELKSVLNAQLRKNEVIANNLANMNSTGFKKDVVFFDIIQQKTGNATQLNLETDFSQGPIEQTDNPLDLAISGKGFFVIEGEQGKAITRNGHFSVDSEGYLVTSSNHYLLGEGGRINLSLNGQDVRNIRINNDGEIYTDEQYLDQLQIVDLENCQSLKKIQDNAFIMPHTRSVQEVDNPVILQGHLEGSNVNAVDEMISLIEVERQFESTQKVIQSLDETTQKTVTAVGRFR